MFYYILCSYWCQKKNSCSLKINNNKFFLTSDYLELLGIEFYNVFFYYILTQQFIKKLLFYEIWLEQDEKMYI